MEPGTAILISAFAGTIGWFVTVRSNRLADRRQHTYRVIIRQQDDERFSTALEKIRQLLVDDDLPAPDDNQRLEDIKQIDYFLNHYEFMSAAIWCGDMDETLIRSCEYSRMTKLFSKMRGYIEASRRFREQPTMYENLENIRARWLTDDLSGTHKLCEFLMLSPYRTLPATLSLVERLELRLRRPLSRS